MLAADEQRRAGELILCPRCAVLQPRWMFARAGGARYRTCKGCRAGGVPASAARRHS